MRTVVPLAVAALACVAGSVEYLTVESSSANSGVAPPHQQTRATPAAEPVRSVERPSAAVPADSPASAPELASTNTAPEVSLRDLEGAYRTARDLEQRIEVVGEIAARNDLDAARCLARLFTRESHPDLKVAILGNLHDFDAAGKGDVRFEVITAAVHKQPRNVRIAALELLDPAEEPRAEAMLRKAMSQDPDHEVRETAAALLEAHLDPAQDAE